MAGDADVWDNYSVKKQLCKTVMPCCIFTGSGNYNSLFSILYLGVGDEKKFHFVIPRNGGLNKIINTVKHNLISCV